jgi:putative transposase
VKRRKGTTTIRVPGVRVASDLVGRDFKPQAPNRLWTSDIKYVSTWEGTLHLATVIDCYSRRVVGWAMRADMQAELVVDALEMAINRRRPQAGLVHHSDQGSQPEFKGPSQHCRLTSRMVVPSLAVLALVVSVTAASVIAEAA